MKKILILEDEIIIANSIQLHLQANGYDTAIATNAPDAEQLFLTETFDLLLSDINLNHPIDGIRFVREVIKDSVPVVFLTAYADLDTLKKAEILCPYAYLIKPFNKDQLLLTLNLSIIHAQKKFLHSGQNKVLESKDVCLSKREIEIVKLLSQSKTTEEIAEALYISPFTVSTHRKNILRKTEAKSVIELISLSIAKGWL